MKQDFQLVTGGRDQAFHAFAKCCYSQVVNVWTLKGKCSLQWLGAGELLSTLRRSIPAWAFRLCCSATFKVFENVEGVMAVPTKHLQQQSADLIINAMKSF